MQSRDRRSFARHCRTAAALACAWLCLCGGQARGYAKEQIEETLPPAYGAAEGYSLYLGESAPYYRLSPHRAVWKDAASERESGRIPALYALIDLEAQQGSTWRPSPDTAWTLETPGSFRAAYSFSLTGETRTKTRYRQRSLACTDCRDGDAAGRVRAILQCAYPFVSAEKMLEQLVEAGVLLSRDGVVSAPINFQNDLAERTVGESELLSAVQAALWSASNSEGAAVCAPYGQTKPVNAQRTIRPDTGEVRTADDARVRANIEAVYAYLCSLPGIPEQKRLLSDLTLAAYWSGTKNENALTIRFRLNAEPDASDTVFLRLGEARYAIGREHSGLPLLLPDTDGCYTLLLSNVQRKGTLSLEICGVQQMRQTAVVYEPQDAAAQPLIGVTSGNVQVAIRREIALEKETRVALRCFAELGTERARLSINGGRFSLLLVGEDGDEVRVTDDLQAESDGVVRQNGLLLPQEGERYVLDEAEPPAGFVRTKQDHRIALENGKSDRLLYRPAADGGAVLRLADADGKGETLSDVGFALYRRVAGTEGLYLGTYTTGQDGSINVNGLPAGTYWFTEIDPPAGYVAEERTEYAFSIGENGGTSEIWAANRSRCSVEGRVRFDGEKQETPSVTIQLYCNGLLQAEQRADKETHWTYCFSDLPLIDSEGNRNRYEARQSPLPGYRTEQKDGDFLNIKRTEDKQFKIVDDRGIPVAGAVFSLRRAADGSHVTTSASDAAGVLHLFGLTVGDYTLANRRAPSGIRAYVGYMTLSIRDPNTACGETEPLQLFLRDDDGESVSEEKIVLRRSALPKTPLFTALTLTAAAFPAVLFAILICRVIKRRKASVGEIQHSSGARIVRFPSKRR